LISTKALEAIAQFVAERSGVLMVDEIYQGLVYGAEPSSALGLPGDVVVINSFSKYFQMTGWRLGWMVAPPHLVREIEKLAQNLFISPSTLAQHAALACFLPETIAIVEERRAELDRRRRFLIPALEKLGFRVAVEPQGAFYVYADCSALTNDSFAFARDVLVQAGVAFTPGKDFGHNAPGKHVRIAYTQPIARLEEAVARLARYMETR
jgi:aspartate/methionine/tyrosine aminotransferase